MIQWHPQFDTGGEVWMLVSGVAVLVLLFPGLFLFYTGLFSQRDVGPLLLRGMAALATLSLVWAVVGYSIAFAPSLGTVPISTDSAPPGASFQEMMAASEQVSDRREDYGRGGVIGGVEYVLLRNIAPQAGVPRALFPARRPMYHVPNSAVMLFHLLVFAAASAPLTVTTFDRINTAGALLFLGIWGIVVYAPLAHWIWGEGWLSEMGAIDSGGGLWHIGVGFSALTCAIVLKSTPSTAPAVQAEVTNDLTLLSMGAALTWGGTLLLHGALSTRADGRAAVAMLNSHLAAAAGVLGWIAASHLIKLKRDSGCCVAGALCGLAAIAPGCSSIVPESSLIVGLVAGVAGCVVSHGLHAHGVRPGFSVFAISGTGGLLGTLLAGVFATSSMAGLDRHGEAIEGLAGGDSVRLGVQALAVASSAAWAVVGTLMCLCLIRVSVAWRLPGPAEEGPQCNRGD